MLASSSSSRSGLRRSSRRSIARSAASESACDCTETYSPAAIDMAPATRPAIPASSTSTRDTPPAATPITRLATDTIPSFAPSTAARSQPMRWMRCSSLCAGRMASHLRTFRRGAHIAPTAAVCYHRASMNVPRGGGELRPEETNGRLGRFFAALIGRRWWVLVVYAVLLPPSAWLASKVDQDNSIDRLIVATDPDYVATRDFEQVFGEGEFALLLAEADDPLAPAVVTRVDEIERAIDGIPNVG